MTAPSSMDKRHIDVPYAREPLKWRLLLNPPLPGCHGVVPFLVSTQPLEGWTLYVDGYSLGIGTQTFYSLEYIEEQIERARERGQHLTIYYPAVVTKANLSADQENVLTVEGPVAEIKSALAASPIVPVDDPASVMIHVGDPVPLLRISPTKLRVNLPETVVGSIRIVYLAGPWACTWGLIKAMAYTRVGVLKDDKGQVRQVFYVPSLLPPADHDHEDHEGDNDDEDDVFCSGQSYRLMIHVVDYCADSPVAGASVEVWRVDDSRYRRNGTTDGDGWVDLGHVSPGEYRIHVEADGYEEIEDERFAVTCEDALPEEPGPGETSETDPDPPPQTEEC